jgi:inosine-uridine nucleoside N-ribohydrolase
MKSVSRFTLLLVASLLTFDTALAQDKAAVKANPIPVIFDTDIGDDIDDTWALGFLLRSPELELKLAVGDNGKSMYRARLLAKFLQQTGRTNVPVGIGMEVERKTNEWQGKWIEGYELSAYPGKVHENGVQAIIDTIMRSSQPVTLICVGPVPNIAAALKREPRIAQRARFAGMHGSIHFRYNSDKPVAEYNVKEAPQACQAAFTAPWDIVITPLDTCEKVSLSGDRYQRMLTSKDPIATNIIANYRLWADARAQGSPDAVPTRSTTLFDTVAVYLAFSQELCGMQDLRIRVTDDGFTIEDPQAKRMHVAMSWKNLEGFEDLLVKRLTSGN